MRHWFSDLTAFRRDPLTLFLEKGKTASEPLEPLALGPAPVFLVADPEWVRPLLKAAEEDADKGRLIHKLRAVIGKSSLTVSGDEHRRRREALHTHLAKGAMERLTTPMAAEIRAVGARIARERVFDPHASMAPLALKMICMVLFGRQVLSPADEQALVKAVRMAEDDVADELFRLLPLSPWARYARNKKREFARDTMNLIVRRVRSSAHDASILRALEKAGLDEQELSDEILTLLITGHHTTGASAAWLLYHLATEPGLADAIAEEAASLSDWSGEIRADRLKHAPLSLALVREVLRLYPSGWWFSRETRRDMEFGGRKLKRGTSLIVCPWHLHRDPKHWDEPERFRLDRSYGSKAYLPFGLGPRACVGMGLAMLELQLIALEFAAAYSFGKVSPYPAPRPIPSVTLIPPDMQIDIRIRESVHLHETARLHASVAREKTMRIERITMHHNNDDEDTADDVRQREQVAVVLRSELVRHVLELPNEARAKLLAFLHLAEDLCAVDANLHTDPSGEIQVRLVSRKNGCADSRPAAGKSPVQLQ